MQDSTPTTKPLDIDPEDEDECLRVFMQSTTCRHKVLASAFDSEQIPTGRFSLYDMLCVCETHSPLQGPLPVPCCDICHPALFNQTRPGKPKTNKEHRLKKLPK